MDYTELPPPPALAGLIHCFWFLRAEPGGSDLQTVVPDGRIELVLHLAEPFDAMESGGRRTRQERALVAGQLTGPFRLATAGPADVVGIRFRSLGARALLGIRLDEITDAVLPLREVAPGLAGTLWDIAASHCGVTARATALAGAVAGMVGRNGIGSRFADAVARLGAADPPGVWRLARELGVSARTLERRFRAEVGLSPRTFARVARFRRAFRLLGRSSAGRWGRVAIEAGYFDQSHLVREFRRFAGVAPSEFFGADSGLARAIMGTEAA
jgi:AraC-like DNA-binding protein